MQGKEQPRVVCTAAPADKSGMWYPKISGLQGLGFSAEQIPEAASNPKPETLAATTVNLNPLASYPEPTNSEALPDPP